MAVDAPLTSQPVTAASAPATSPVTNQGYVRPPGRDVPGIIRAPIIAAEIPAEPARPAPLFSNEGMVRQAEVRRGSRILDPRVRGGIRRRAVGAMLLAGLLGVVLLAFAPAAVLSLLPNNSGLARSPGASSNAVLGVSRTQPDGSSTGDASVAPSGVVVGDSPPAPDAVRQTAAPGTTTPKPATPTLAPVPISLPTPTPKSPTPVPTLPPTPTPVPTLPPTPKPPTPTPVPTLRPTPTPVPTLRPTPTPALNFAAFEPAGSTTGGHTATYSVLQGTNLTFIVDGLGGASCTLSSNPHRPGAPRSQTVPGTAPQVGSIFLTTWGSNWPVGAYTVTATCTLAGRPTATAAQMVGIR
jgi:outer membrane biosynthesis protein TonB